MSNLRPYWQRHRLQARFLALAILLLSPIAIPIILVFIFRAEIAMAMVENFRDLWVIVKRGA